MRSSLLFLPLAAHLLVACTDKGDGGTDGDGGISSDTGSDTTSDTGTEVVDADDDGYPAEDDCDDADPAVNPGAAEVCDGVDNDCDDLVDDEDDSLDESTATSWYTDGDEDGYGDGEVLACVQPEGTAAEAGDCDDADPAYNPGAVEDDCTDPNDYNCDGSVGYADEDEDGFAACEECDDTEPTTYPGADDTWYDGVDSDCAGDDDYDADLDGYQSADHGGDDCDDGDDAVFPGATDTWYDGVDSDCDGASDYDADGDGDDSDSYGGGDCDDTDESIYTGATDTWYDGVDSDCDGASDYDADGDGYDSDGYGGDDCDDDDLAISPDAAEVCDEIDNDCDGDIDEDSVCGIVLEDFEDGAAWSDDWSADAGTLSTSPAYEGSYAILDPSWTYTTTETIGPGESVSMWVYGGTGRAYLGFDSSSSGTRSFVTSWNSGDIRFQLNESYGYTELSTETLTVPTGEWLLMEVTIGADGYDVDGILYDEDGTILATVSETYDEPHSGAGGIAIRSFSDVYIDYIEVY